MQMKRGFTLMELLVALAMASILSLTVLGSLGRIHKSYCTLQKNYEEESRMLLLKLRCSSPYPPGDCK